MSATPRVVYSPRYNIRLFGLERLHPFDTCKHTRAWRLLRSRDRAAADRARARPEREADEALLLKVHSRAYLAQLRDPAHLAKILEVPQVAHLPPALTDRVVLRAMRWATAGTVLAAHEALRAGLAFNLGGGYHHASADRGEGFCVYSDIGLALWSLRARGGLSGDARIVYIDLDAHQGNGVARLVKDDRSVFIFDMYNASIYPGDREARERIDHELPLRPGTSDSQYLAALTRDLPPFLQSISRNGRPAFAIYIAGTDVLGSDPLGGLALSADAVFERDRFVVERLRAHAVPVLVLPGGGYSRESYQLIARTIAWALGEP